MENEIVAKLWYFSRSDEEGTMNKLEFSSEEEYERFIEAYGDIIEIFKEDWY